MDTAPKFCKHQLVSLIADPAQIMIIFDDPHLVSLKDGSPIEKYTCKWDVDGEVAFDIYNVDELQPHESGT